MIESGVKKPIGLGCGRLFICNLLISKIKNIDILNQFDFPFHGWINMYKPRGISSAKAVACFKYLIIDFINKYHDKINLKQNSVDNDKKLKNQKIKFKIGHTGTLDQEAEGILPIAVGEATKLVSMIMDQKKTYVFDVQFGAQTDTLDIGGEIIKSTNILPSLQDIKNILPNFIGDITQQPPAYSAIKINGQRAYNLARKQNIDIDNIDVQIKSRNVTIYNLQLLNFDEQKSIARFEVDCSKGTYVRSLARDIALSLNSLAYVIKLIRTRVGRFDLNSCLLPSKLISEIDLNNDENNQYIEKSKKILEITSKHVIKIDYPLDDIPVINLNLAQNIDLKQGKLIDFDNVNANDLKAYLLKNNPEDNLVILKYNDVISAIAYLKDGYLKSKRIFNL